MSERKINILQQIQQAQQIRSQSRQSSFKEEDAQKQQHNLGQKVQSIFRQQDQNHDDDGEEEVSIDKSIRLQQQPIAVKNNRKSKNSLSKMKGITEDGLQNLDLWLKLDEILKRIRLKKYIKAFLSLSRIRLYNQLTPSQIQKINDPSYWKPSLQNDNKKKEQEFNLKNDYGQYKKSIKKYFKSIKIPIFLPHHILFDFWQFLKICSIMICFYCYLVCFSFNLDLDQQFPIVLLIMSQACIVLDIFITMNTGIYIKGTLCTDRKELFNYYKSSKTFYYDISASFFTTLFYLLYFSQPQPNRSSKILLLTIIFKINDFHIVIKKIKQKFLLDRRAQNMIELIDLVKNILVISHIFACIWVLVGLSSQQYYSEIQSTSSETPHSWLALMSLQNEQWYIQYLNSYYYIAVTMSTVGYGDIRPTNPIEVIIAVFIVMTCSVIFGFTLNSIGEIVQDFFQFEKQIQEKRYIIANYMDKNYISQITRKNVFEYLEYYWKEQVNENIQEENGIISQLSDTLKEELLIQSNRLILKENKVLREYFSPELLAKCIPIIKEQRYTPNEVIINNQEGNTDCSIYFVLFGEVDVIHGTNISKRKNKQQITTLKRGNSFGEVSFFTGQTGCLSFVSKNFSKILKIKREDFINLVKKDSEQYEIFCKLNDSLIQSSDTSLCYVKCSSCNSESHDIKTCPSLHYIPRKFKIFAQNQISQPQMRQYDYIRKRDYKFGSLYNFELFNQICCTFIDQNLDLLFQYDSEYLEFKHFLKPKNNPQSDEEIENIKEQKSEIDFNKLRKITNSELLLDSPSQPKNRLSIQKKKGIGFQKTSFEQLGGSLINSNEEYLKDNPISRIQEFMLGLQKKMSTNESETNQELLFKKDFVEEDRKIEQPKVFDKYIYNARQTFQRRITPKDTYYNHVTFDAQATKKDYQSKQTKVLAHELINSSQLLKNLRDESLDFDIFIGNFEKMTCFTHYFPKYNYEKVINSMNKIPQLQKSQKLIMMKDSNNSQIGKKIKERKYQSILNIRDSNNSQIRSKVKSEYVNSFDKENHVKSNFPNMLKQFNEFISIEENSNQKSSFLNNSTLNQIQNLDNTVNIQIDFDDPQTPPRNEKPIIESGLPSIANFKNSFYNFANEELSSHQIFPHNNQK